MGRLLFVVWRDVCVCVVPEGGTRQMKPVTCSVSQGPGLSGP